MHPGVYYLYKYKNDQKLRNVGFLKYTLDSDICFLQICARGLSVLQKDSVPLAILYHHDQKIHRMSAGSIPCEAHAINCKTHLSLKTLNFPYPSDKICGFLLQLSDTDLIAAMDESISLVPSKLCSFMIPQVSPELPSSQDSTCNCEKLESKTSSDILKIQRSELSLLPRQYWYLSNNHFLMHGYYNYHHLLLVKEKDHFVLGIPGIYDKYEARAAASFGFPVFSESYTKMLDLSSEETCPYKPFGYWCKNLPITK